MKGTIAVAERHNDIIGPAVNGGKIERPITVKIPNRNRGREVA